MLLLFGDGGFDLSRRSFEEEAEDGLGRRLESLEPLREEGWAGGGRSKELERLERVVDGGFG